MQKNEENARGGVGGGGGGREKAKKQRMRTCGCGDADRCKDASELRGIGTTSETVMSLTIQESQK